MAQKPKLYYFNGRGKMESIRWLLAAVGVEFEEEFLETREQYEALLKEGALLFQQVPMVEMDGMKLAQTKAILQYIAGKHNIYGKDLKERALIDMYVEGATDLMDIILIHSFLLPEEKESHIEVIAQKTKSRYFPVYEKALKDHGDNFLVANLLSWADIQLLEVILMVEEKCADVLDDFPLLQAFKERLIEIPTIKAFLQPGSQRKPQPDDKYVATVRAVLQMYNKVAFEYAEQKGILPHAAPNLDVSEDLELDYPTFLSYKGTLSLFGGSSRGAQLLVYPGPKIGASLPGMAILFDRARSFGRDAHGAVREEGDTRLASQISRINPSDQWGDRCRSQIALTSKPKKEPARYICLLSIKPFAVTATSRYCDDVNDCSFTFTCFDSAKCIFTKNLQIEFYLIL
ncbi:glutathione S-transferase A4-like [Pelodytes ibericus]